MKAVISNRIYLNVDDELRTKLKEELLYTIDRRPQSEYPEIIQNCVDITNTTCSIPSGRTDLIPEDYTIVDKRVLPKVNIPTPSFTTRESQREAAEAIQHGGIVCAKPGFGKTIVGYQIASMLQTKTLVICTTTAIRDMWIKECEKWFGFTPGIIGSGKFDVDPPIVIANIQTLRNKVSQVSSMFGLVIVDEVHRSVAATFSHVLNNLKCRYKVGLSGTIERKDGKHVVLQDYFGHDVYHAAVENTIPPTIHLHQHPYELNMNEFTPWADVVTRLCGNKNYLGYVLQLAKHYASMGHKVLVISSRTNVLEYGHLNTPDSSCIITGEVKGMELRAQILHELRENPNINILWGSQSIFSEGVSENQLSCCILATPINNDPLLEQIAGRIMRKAEGKLDPVLVDINLQGNTGRNHANCRKRFYIDKGWKIKNG